MRATLQAQPRSEGDEKSTPALANSPDGGNAERGRRAMSADGPPPEGFSRLKRRPGTKVFTKLAHVKSRTSWTAERHKLLADMWDRGESAPAIAAALGCKVGAVNVARARFGLKPRRTVSGRPPCQPDEPAHKIDRVAFFTSRLMEFCTEKELVAQTGHESYEWPLVVVKELVDNSIDACEEAAVAPVITVAIWTDQGRKRIVIEDNGPGIPPATVAGIIDYDVRASSKEAVISPTRGRQGNALKTVLPMPYVLGGEGKGETWIEARGVRHRILFSVNQIKQEPIVQDMRTPSKITTGTRVTVFWPKDNGIDAAEIADLLTQFVWCNPHLTLVLAKNGKTLLRHHATNPDWAKYRSCDATSAHWYTLEQFERYAGALIEHDREIRITKSKSTRRNFTLREFIAQFRGMSAHEKQKLISRKLGALHMSLYRFFGSESEVNHRSMEKLLRLVQKHTRPVRPELLGIIGEEHLRSLCKSAGGEPQSFKYFLSAGQDAKGVPYVVEIATCPFKRWVDGKQEQNKAVDHWSPISVPPSTTHSRASRAWKAWRRF